MKRPMLALATLLAVLPVAASAEPAPAAAELKPGLLGAAINVVDLAREVDFYTRGLGWKVAATLPLGSRSETILMQGDDRNAAAILLMHDTAPGAPGRIDHGNGFSRLVIRTPDLAALAARLDAAGYAHGEIRSATMGVRVMMLTDPEGFRIELVEQVPKGNP